MKYIACLLLFPVLLAGCQRNFDERLQRQMAEHSRKTCPMVVEPYNTLDSVAYRPDSRTVFYYYTLSDSLDTPLAHEVAVENEPLLRKKYLEGLANSVELKEIKENGVNFCVIYRSKSTGREILRLRFTKDDYTRRRQ